MTEVIAWVTFAGAWLLVAGRRITVRSSSTNSMSTARESGDQGVSGPDRAGPAVGVVVAAAAGHVRAAPPLD
jgi:hypothetical protein